MINAKHFVLALVSCFMTLSLQAQNLSKEILQPDKKKEIRQLTQYYSPPAKQKGKSKILKTKTSIQNIPKPITNPDQDVSVDHRKITIQANSDKAVNPQKRKTKRLSTSAREENAVVNNNENTCNLEPKKLAKRNSQDIHVSKASLNQKQSVPLDIIKRRQDILSKLNMAKSQAEKEKYQQLLNQFDNKKF